MVVQVGSGCLDLCWVGCGRVDAAYAGVAGEGWQPWDYAAGWLFIEEAGGVVSQVSALVLSFEAFLPGRPNSTIAGFVFILIFGCWRCRRRMVTLFLGDVSNPAPRRMYNDTLSAISVLSHRSMPLQHQVLLISLFHLELHL